MNFIKYCKFCSDFSKTSFKIYYFLLHSKMAKWPNYFFSGKQFQKRPNGNPGSLRNIIHEHPWKVTRSKWLAKLTSGRTRNASTCQQRQQQSRPGVNFTNILWAAFAQLFSTYSLAFLIFWRNDIGAKAAHKMLVKLTTDHHHCLSNSCCDRGQGK